jgi:POT family proton-dependent oligopeptide transporter
MGAEGRYPPQIKYIVGNEACERFSFYGLSSILTLYMTQWLLWGDPDAKANFHFFQVATYLTPLLGGWIADRFLGRYRTILYVSFFYVAGHATLALFADQRTGFVVGLGLVALGAGGIKPCVSAFVGDQFAPDRRAQLERMYGWFYWIINLGSLTSKALIPKLLGWHGPGVAFALPGLLMVIATAVFFAGRKRYVASPPSGPEPHGFLRVVGRALRRFGTGHPGQHWLELARDQHPAEAVDGARAVLRIGGVFAGAAVFWALFDQKGSSWTLQAKTMGLSAGGWSLDPGQLQALNPLLVLLLVPLFTWVIFPTLGRRGVALGPLAKMSAGMFITVGSFAAAAVLQTVIDADPIHPPHVLWQLPQYLFLTVGEVLVSVTGLEFAYTQAPRSMRSTIMSVWFLTMATGNLFTALVSKILTASGAGYFWFFAALMLAAALAFRQVALRYRPTAA